VQEMSSIEKWELQNFSMWMTDFSAQEILEGYNFATPTMFIPHEYPHETPHLLLVNPYWTGYNPGSFRGCDRKGCCDKVKPLMWRPPWHCPGNMEN